METKHEGEPEIAEVERVFLMADLAGYTALTEAMGAREAADVVSRYVGLAEAALRPPAMLVERVGDEVLIVSDDAVTAVETALALRDAIEAEARFPSVRVGLHSGLVLEQQGRYFGAALNLTARVAAHARAGQILCTDRIADAVKLPTIDYSALGTVRFRNVLETIAVFEIIERAQHPEASVIDPVCRMHVHPDAAPARLLLAGATYYFCSLECARRFTEHPDAYVPA